MTPRYVFAPVAARDLVEIWRYIKKQSSVAVTDRVERVILDRILLLAKSLAQDIPAKILQTNPSSSFRCIRI